VTRVFSWRDRNSWPGNWPRFNCEADDPQLSPYGRRLRSEYCSIRAYHGARPLNVEAYYNSGILISDCDNLVCQARAVFASSAFPAFSPSEIDQAVNSLPRYVDGSVCVALDDRQLVEWAGHYMIYGSEYIMAIAGCLPPIQGMNCQQYLKGIGAPTVFELEVPVSAVSDYELNALALSIGEEESVGEVPCNIDFTFELHESLAPECIIGHYHPREIWDQHDGGRIYVWEG